MDAKTPVILLAGGNSSRMGVPKGLIEMNGRTWLENQIERLSQCGLREIIVVLGYHAEKYRERLPWLGTRLPSVENAQPEFGPFSSITTGIKQAFELFPN